MVQVPFVISNPEEITLEKLILVDMNVEKVVNMQAEIIYGDPPSSPFDYIMYQNYPNPFNPSTTIEFSLPEDVNSVKLSIYNVLGEKITELINTSLPAGKYSYQWDATYMVSGMYIYELRTDKFVSVKKMILLK
jgi:hypothetical protein